MKRTLIAAIGISLASIAFAGPHHGPHHGPGPWRPYHHHYSGEHMFWGSFAGSALGTFIGTVVTRPVVQETVVVQQPTVVTQPVVVQQPTTIVTTQAPVVQPQHVWVEGHYVNKIVNGVSTQEWVPGHFETR